MSVTPPKPIQNSMTTGGGNSDRFSPNKITSSRRSTFVSLSNERKKESLNKSLQCVDLSTGEPATKQQHVGHDKTDTPSSGDNSELMTNLRTKSTLQVSASVLQGMSLTSSEPKSSATNSLDTARNTARAEEIEYVDNEVIHTTKNSACAPNARVKNKSNETEVPFQQKHLQSPSNLMRDLPKDPITPRRGKWSAEEEAYATAVIEAFSSGYLDALPGTTLRTYLSEKLQCDPMRITKKFTGDYSIGKKVFHPVARNEAAIKIMEETKMHLNSLFEEWKERLESQRQEITRKSLAAEAVSAVSTLNRVSYHEPSHSSSSIIFEPFLIPAKQLPRDHLNSSNKHRIQNTIARTVSWLEQAESILSKNSLDKLTHYSLAKPLFQNENRFGGGDDSSSQFFSKIELEMKEILGLITEGPVVLSNSRVIPTILGKANQMQSHPNRYCATSIHSRHQDGKPPRISLPIHHSQENNKSWHEIHRAIGELSPVVKDQIYVESPPCPMKILASLSSQAAPVPIVDDDDEGKETRIASSQLTHYDVRNELKPNKRFKAERTKSVPAYENSSTINDNAEDVKTFVDFLHSVVRIND
mmetsp:Transcript_29496/g.56050  ORF Transcript_29496/g.56050 Transcript_29496/m.56050 type:complete len:586 (+) Transcript_29496:193-1950(+)